MQNNISIDVHPYTDRGSREYQEDYFYTGPPMRPGEPWLGIVSDGMGGHLGGDIASKAGVHAIRLTFETLIAQRMPTEHALVEATTQGHQAVLQAAEQAKATGNMGATVVAFVVDGSTLLWCSAGDSRLYLYRGETLTQLSRDFTLGEDMKRGVANGDWTAEDIENSPQRNALTSFMGTDAWRNHSGSYALKHGDVIVCCSDGVYGTIDGDGIAAACSTAGDAPTAQHIVENIQHRVAAVGKPNQDNSTAIVVRVNLPGSVARLAPAATPTRAMPPKAIVGGAAVLAVAIAGAIGFWALSGKKTLDDPAAAASASSAPASVAAPAAVLGQTPPETPGAKETNPADQARDMNLEAQIAQLEHAFKDEARTAKQLLQDIDRFRDEHPKLGDDKALSVRLAKLTLLVMKKLVALAINQAKEKEYDSALRTLASVLSQNHIVESLKTDKESGAAKEAQDTLDKAKELKAQYEKKKAQLDGSAAVPANQTNQDTKPKVKVPTNPNTATTPGTQPRAGTEGGPSNSGTTAPNPSQPASPAASGAATQPAGRDPLSKDREQE